ncbi:hypothetical protein ABVT39_020407 [Epinephelus coioides]
MATGHSSEPSSQGDPLDEHVLVDTTKELIPSFATDIQKTEPSELEAILSQLTTTAIVTPLKGQALTEMLEKMAVVMAAERRALRQTLESTQQALAKAERDISELKTWPNTSQEDTGGATSKDEENTELQGKNSELVSHLHDRDMELFATTRRLTMVTEEHDEAKDLLKKVANEIRDFKAQVKVQSKYKDSDQEQISNLRQLVDAKDRVAESQHQQFIKEEELADAKRELQYSFEQSQSRRVFLDEPPLEAKTNTKSLKSSQEDLLLQSSPLFSHEHASCSRDIRPPADQTRGAFTQHPDPNDPDDEVVYTKPSGAIMLFPSTDDKEMAIQTVTVMSVDSAPDSGPVSSHENKTKESTGASPDSTMEHKPDFASQVEQVLANADALNSDEECEKLCAVLLKYQTSFAKESLDCGLTTIHSVQIPTPPNAPPTYV